MSSLQYMHDNLLNKAKGFAHKNRSATCKVYGQPGNIMSHQSYRAGHNKNTQDHCESTNILL